MYGLTKPLNPSLHVMARARKMWAVKYDAGTNMLVYRVTPHGAEFDHKNKDHRYVIFDYSRGAAACISIETGEQCSANRYGLLCGHVLASIRSMVAGSKRREAKAA